MPPVSGTCAAIASLMQAIQDVVTGRGVDACQLRASVADAAESDPVLLTALDALERGDVVAAKRAVRCALDGVLGDVAEQG